MSRVLTTQPVALPHGISVRVTELRAEITRCNEIYWGSDSSRPSSQPAPRSDESYDNLTAELEQLEAKYPALRTADSPTQYVGPGPSFADLSLGSTKLTHRFPMLSLRNIATRQELDDFHKSLTKLLDAHGLLHGPLRYCLELKYDGMAISLLFRKVACVFAMFSSCVWLVHPHNDTRANIVGSPVEGSHTWRWT